MSNPHDLDLALVEVTAGTADWGPAPSYTPPNPLVIGGEIKLEHLTELRAAINQLRAHAGLPAANWTVDPNPERLVTLIKADHVLQLRSRLEEALLALHLATGGYEHPNLQNGDPIYAKDYQELRDQIAAAWNHGTSIDMRWLVTDQLGTPRMIFDKTGSLANTKRHDYLPFGEELTAGQGLRSPALGYSADGVRQKFTSKERDNETGLDYFLARYYSSTQGRFTTPDEFSGGPDELFEEAAAGNPTFYADLTDPQSLNKYQYAYNNPLRFVDPDGHQGKETVNQILKDTVVGGAKEPANVAIDTSNLINLYIKIQSFGTADWGQTKRFEPGTRGERMAMIGVDISLVAESAISAARAGAAMVTSRRVAAMTEEMKATKSAASTLEPGPFAEGSIPARGPQRNWNSAEMAYKNEPGVCHTCGTPNPGTKSGKWTLDHQPVTTLNSKGLPQRLFKQCLTCMYRQAREAGAAKSFTERFQGAGFKKVL